MKHFLQDKNTYKDYTRAMQNEKVRHICATSTTKLYFCAAK